MLNTTIENASRRSFMQGAAGLTLGFCLPATAAAPVVGQATSAPPAFAPNAFLRIAPDNTVTVISKHLEMGQGTYTGLATILAEELDADWQTVRIEGAPADAQRYNNLFWGPNQGTGGSTAMANSWEQLRNAGAAGRALPAERHLLEARRHGDRAVREHEAIARHGDRLVDLRDREARDEGRDRPALRRVRVADDHQLPDGLGFPISISVGVAELDPARMPSVEDWLVAGDRALYRAKDGGRNQVVVHST